MANFSLRVGATFELEGTTYQIERLHQADSYDVGQVVLQRCHDGRTVLKTERELLSAYAAGLISAFDASTSKARSPLQSAPLTGLSEIQMREFKRRRAYVLALVDQGSFTFEPDFIEPFIAAKAAEMGDADPPSRATLWRWHSRFKAFNDVRALIPLFRRRGSTTSLQDARVLELLAESVDAAFKLSPKATGADIHGHLAGRIQRENARRLPDEQLQTPSKRTTYRLLGRVEAYDQTVLREGAASADRRFRIAKLGPRTQSVLERVEADHTPLDLFLIDEVTWVPLGRPTLTVFFDQYSRFPLGYYLSFGGTSAAAVMGALRHAILPKTPVVEVIPDLPVQHLWPCFGIMDVLVLDNGLEFHGLDLESVALDLMIRLQFCPKRTPRFKGAIERYLKTINYFFAHQVPGAAMARLADRGDYDPQKHALLTMSEFKHLFEKWVLDVYAQTVHRGIGTTPWAKWHEGIARRTPQLPADLKSLQRRIGLVRERALRPDGVNVEGIRYADDSLLPLLKKWGAGTKVRVVLDAEDLGDVQVWGPEEPDPVTVLAADQAYAKGLTLTQHQLLRQQVREAGKDAEDTQELITAKYQMAVALEQLVTSRKQRTRRRAAQVHGITSTKPQGRLEPASVPVAPAPKKVEVSKQSTAAANEPPALLPAFRLAPGRSE
jgi:putative transposase